jgi:hypothetical protein
MASMFNPWHISASDSLLHLSQLVIGQETEVPIPLASKTATVPQQKLDKSINEVPPLS